MLTSVHLPFTAKLRRIRFEDDDTKDLNEVEKDTRLRLSSKSKSKVSPLQARMLMMAGQEVPEDEGHMDQAEKEDSEDEVSSWHREVWWRTLGMMRDQITFCCFFTYK